MDKFSEMGEVFKNPKSLAKIPTVPTINLDNRIENIALINKKRKKHD
jgi:hypothetical protein